MFNNLLNIPAIIVKTQCIKCIHYYVSVCIQVAIIMKLESLKCILFIIYDPDSMIAIFFINFDPYNYIKS